jgi:uncharacterized protein YutE (UPF0331/DUF86 family)
MVDKNVIAGRIEAIEKHLARIGGYARMSRREFLIDLDAQDIVEYNLFQIVNHLIDMIQRIVVDENIGFPGSAYDAAEILRDKGILSENDFTVLKKMIGFRNIIGHDYVSVNKEFIYDTLINGPEDIKNVISAMARRFV